MNAFLSKPHILNVFQSGHKAWMFITEAVSARWPASTKVILAGVLREQCLAQEPGRHDGGYLETGL